jgi:hypothetical protein
MKKQIITNDGQTKMYINISLNDDCKNGHKDFSITADGYEKNERGQFRESFGGCCHSEILKARPKLQFMVDLHLSDSRGAPMHPISNGIYHLKEKIEDGMSYLRCTLEQAKELILYVEDENAFQYMLGELGIIDQWQQEAQKGIDYLSDGETFVHTGSMLKTLTADDIALVKVKMKNGWFSLKQVHARIISRQQTRKAKYIKETKARAKKDIAKIRKERDIKLIVATVTEKTNFIYYNHTEELSHGFCSKKYWDNDLCVKVERALQDAGFMLTIKRYN